MRYKSTMRNWIEPIIEDGAQAMNAEKDISKKAVESASIALPQRARAPFIDEYIQWNTLISKRTWCFKYFSKFIINDNDNVISFFLFKFFKSTFGF